MPSVTLVRPAGPWDITSALPDDWSHLVRELDGGFFHTPPGLHSGAPEGELLYARCRHAGEVVAIALGVRAPCRLSQVSRHAYFPSPPAIRPRTDRREVVVGLAKALRAEGLAEVRWDSFDAGSARPPAPAPTRWEYVIDLAAVRATARWPFSTHHRRVLRRGDRAGWCVAVLRGDAAVRALTQVLAHAAERGVRRGARFTVSVPAAVTEPASSPDWGAEVFAAMAGDELLAAALVGRAGTRAYYVMGGSVRAGYEVGASTWLHAHLAGRFVEAGMRCYNLGGAPLHAHDPADPSYGLHRFKSGFGATVIGCAGDRWILRPMHQGGHRLFGWATRWLL